MKFDQTTVAQLEIDLNDALFDAYAAKKVTAEQIKPIAQEVVAELNKVTSQETLQVFFDTIVQNYEFFGHLRTEHNGAQQMSDEKVVIDKLSKYITSLEPTPVVSQ